MLFTPDTISANTARLGTMSSAQKDRLIAKMFSEIRQLRMQIRDLYAQIALTQEAYNKMVGLILQRLDAIESLAGEPARQTVIREVRWATPPIAPVQAPRPEPQADILDQVDSIMSSSHTESMDLRPMPVLNFEGADA